MCTGSAQAALPVPPYLDHEPSGSHTGEQMSQAKGLEINWFTAAGSALGSVTSAVLLSTLGATGTIIGAGLGTLIITVGGAVYGHYLQRAKTNIEQTAGKVKRRQRGEENTAKLSDTAPITAQKDPEHAVGSARATDAAKPRFTQILRDIQWKRVAWLAAGLFVLTMAIILVFELATGRPVSSYTGGTSPASTGTSLTGVTDPAPENPPRTPEQQNQPERPDPPEVPEEPAEPPPGLGESYFVPEQEPTTPVEPQEPWDAPEEQPQEVPEQAPRQEEPVEPTE